MNASEPGNNTCVVSLGRKLKLHDEFLDKKTDISLMDYIIAPFDGQWTKATIVCGFPKKKEGFAGLQHHFKMHVRDPHGVPGLGEKIAHHKTY